MTDHQKKNRKSYCSEPLELVENYQQALVENFKGWDIHHRGEILPCGRFSTDDLKKFGLYWNRPASELIWLRHGEHIMLHNIGNTYMKGHKHSEESRQKMSEANKGKHKSTETRNKIAEARKGKHLSEETCKKLSAALKGKPTWNKGKTSCYSKETLQKKSKSMTGKLWWTNGIQNKLLKECPGEGWTRGRLRFK